MAKSKYGNMPTPPMLTAKVKGDAGTYKVFGFDWVNNKVLLNRTCCYEWVPISKVALSPALDDDSHQ
ncbi:hypothetical protein ACTG16_22800 [Aeromonas sp. 23P]|uniref:hypothetical protein n=1 Tax=Aeromonas sp. 23P TaxID=3452716 RepID=UPI003F7A27F3|nr:hypothetical protein [Aeromonas veronii]